MHVMNICEANFVIEYTKSASDWLMNYLIIQCFPG